MPSLNLAFVTHFYSTKRGRSDAAWLPDQVASFQIDYSFPLAQGYVHTAGKEKGMHFYLASLKSLVSECPLSGHPFWLTLQKSEGTAACQASLSFISQSLLKFISIELLMSSNHLILCRPLLLLPSIFPASGSFPMSLLFTYQIAKYWSFSFSISPSSKYSGLISFRIDWFDLLAVQGILRSLLQHHSVKASIIWCSAYFMVQLSHAYMTTGKSTALTICTFVGKMISLLFNSLSRFVIVFLLRSKCLIILWLHSLSTVVLELKNIKSATVSTFSPSIWHEVMGPDAMILVLNVEF